LLRELVEVVADAVIERVEEAVVDAQLTNPPL